MLIHSPRRAVDVMHNQHLEGELAPPGSTLAHALRRVPEERRLPCLGLFGLHRAMKEIVFSGSETVYVQLGWWCEEVDRLLGDRPRHPVTQALSAWPDYEQARPMEWITNLEPVIGTARFDSEEQLIDLCAALSAPLFAAAARLVGAVQAEDDAAAHKAGVAYTLFDFVQNLGVYLRSGIVPIPRDEMTDGPDQASGLLQAGTTPAFAAMMQVQYRRVAILLDDLTEPSSRCTLPARIISAINLATLEEIRRSGYDVIDQRIDITPLRKAWIAWRSERQSARA